MRSLRRLAGASAAAVLIAALAAGGCSRGSADSEATREEAVLVGISDVVTAETRRLEAGTPFTGELEPIESVQVIARFDGDLETVRVREGQAVRKGETLAIYAPRDVEDARASADANLLAARAALAAAENGERRARRLLDAGAAAPSDLEAAQSQRTAAEAGVKAAEAAANHAKEDAERLDVPSPIAGSVSRTYVRSGSRTAIGDPIATVVDTRALELSATVPSEALARVQPGTPIRFHVSGFAGEVFEGKIARVNPSTEPGTRQIRIYARIDNPDGRLVGGLFASGRIVDSVRASVTAVPIDALRREGETEVVYRLRGGRAYRVAVKQGLLDEDAGVVELLGDVRPGDSLLSGVLPGLTDSARVRILR